MYGRKGIKKLQRQAPRNNNPMNVPSNENENKIVEEDEDRRHPRVKRIKPEIGQASKARNSTYDHSSRNEAKRPNDRRRRRRPREHTDSEESHKSRRHRVKNL